MNDNSPHLSRFMAKVTKEDDGCWNWTASKHKTGYGVARLNGQRVYAHRAAYEMFVAPVPDGMDIDHICHNRGCVNPQHLRAISHKQNCENRAGAQKNNSTGVRGVTRIGNRWMAYATHNKVRYTAGRYDTKQEAAAAVVELRNSLYTHNLLDRTA